MARKQKHPEHVNHERWLVSYADFITLLFAFFTTLYAISTVDAKKAGKLVYAMRAAFNLDFFTTDKPILGLVPADKPIPDPDLDQPAQLVQELVRRQPSKEKSRPRRERRDIRALADAFARAAARERLARHVSVRQEPRGLVISLEGVGFFATGSAQIRPKVRRLLARLGALLRDLGHPVRVEGHADGQGSEGANWELSSRRAVAVVRLWLEEVSFPPKRIAAAGYGSHRPIAKGDDPEARRRNRRVDVVILSEEAAREEPP